MSANIEISTSGSPVTPDSKVRRLFVHARLEREKWSESKAAELQLSFPKREKCGLAGDAFAIWMQDFLQSVLLAQS